MLFLILRKESMQFHNKPPFKTRRLSTASSCIEKYQPLATDWKWYWLDEQNKWCQYGEQDLSGFKSSEVDSNDIEQNYLENLTGQMRFATLQFEYIMDFQKMEQLNLTTKKSRKVRRRPVFVDMKEIDKRKKRSAEIDPRMNRAMSSNMDVSCIPPEWSIDRGLSSDQVLDHFRRVKISESDSRTRDEYKKVKDLFGMSMPAGLISSIERIENGELWMNFASKRDKMKRKKKSGDLNERRLFHGTYHRYVDAICRQGFDFRFSGKSVGTKYGKGSYFSKSSIYADSYTDESKEMFVVLVLAGDTVKGDPSYVRPPPKNPRDPHELYDSCVDDVNSPNIYVIFTFDQVYPQYVVKYKRKSVLEFRCINFLLIHNEL
ncbi:hypothetical protein KUTeg_001547 [Tegillarca granosa]|uniref:Poly [ADP-ribose] polymerase n=1 Tax=Tegillarca granosa TaxID=220873 RepID=A0ABQ9FUL4_TEGGR|nr:hypothetical protein KUTeg_001547 [Tegillarca granosa]